MTTTNIQQHLDMAATHGGYLDAINGTSPESLIDAQQKMLPFWEAIDYQRDKPVLSIGVGQGEELHALVSTNPGAHVVGLDIAQSTLDRAAQRLEQHRLQAELVMADAADTDSSLFEPASFGGIVMSAVMHEIFSYHEPNGHEALRKAIGGAATLLSEGGVLYVRDFVSPPVQDGLKLIPKSSEAQEFTDYFRREFRVGLDDTGPVGLPTNPDGTETAGSIMQVLMHFRNHWNDANKGYTHVGDTSWKELYESYTIPNRDGSGESLSAEELCDEVIAMAASMAQELKLANFGLIDRRKINMFLGGHFTVVNADDGDITPVFLSSATAKLEATFTKIAT